MVWNNFVGIFLLLIKNDFTSKEVRLCNRSDEFYIIWTIITCFDFKWIFMTCYKPSFNWKLWVYNSWFFLKIKILSFIIIIIFPFNDKTVLRDHYTKSMRSYLIINLIFKFTLSFIKKLCGAHWNSTHFLLLISSCFVMICKLKAFKFASQKEWPRIIEQLFWVINFEIPW